MKGETLIRGEREKVDEDSQTTDAGNDEGWGRTQGVDKMDTKVKLWEGCPDNGLHKQRTDDMSRFINVNALNSLTKHLQRFHSLVLYF